jgi:hypothetical protein
MTADRAPGTTEQPTAEQPAKDDCEDTTEPVDAESLHHWQQACAAMPPMTADEIETVAVVLRRIDQRRKS